MTAVAAVALAAAAIAVALHVTCLSHNFLDSLARFGGSQRAVGPASDSCSLLLPRPPTEKASEAAPMAVV